MQTTIRIYVTYFSEGWEEAPGANAFLGWLPLEDRALQAYGVFVKFALWQVYW